MKLNLIAQHKKDDGSVLAQDDSGDQPTFTAAKNVLAAKLAARRQAAQNNAQQYVDAETLFNS